jgi:opacity protein-like surface antigen
MPGRAHRASLVFAVVIVVLGPGGPAAAQTLGAGVHAGVSLVRLASDQAVDTEFAPTLVVGGQVELRVLEPLVLRLEVEYARKGGTVTATQAGSPAVDYSLGYLAFPVNVRYDLGAGAAEAYVVGGASFGVLLAATQRRASGEELDVADRLAGLEVTLDLGAGIGYRVSPHVTVAAEVTYSLGLTQVAGADAAVDVKPWKSNTVKLAFGLTYTFGAGRPESPVPILARR